MEYEISLWLVQIRIRKEKFTSSLLSSATVFLFLSLLLLYFSLPTCDILSSSHSRCFAEKGSQTFDNLSFLCFLALLIQKHLNLLHSWCNFPFFSRQSLRDRMQRDKRQSVSAKKLLCTWRSTRTVYCMYMINHWYQVIIHWESTSRNIFISEPQARRLKIFLQVDSTVDDHQISMVYHIYN